MPAIIDWLHAPEYEVTAEGRVFSLRKWRGQVRREIYCRLDKDGYPIVNFTINGKSKTMHVHRLVAARHLSPRPSSQHQLRHRNGIRSDCRADNLTWGTAQENMDDRARHGRTVRGDQCHTAKLEQAEVIEIKRVDPRIPHAFLAPLYGVSAETISHIRRGKTWGHLQ